MRPGAPPERWAAAPLQGRAGGSRPRGGGGGGTRRLRGAGLGRAARGGRGAWLCGPPFRGACGGRSAGRGGGPSPRLREAWPTPKARSRGRGGRGARSPRLRLRRGCRRAGRREPGPGVPGEAALPLGTPPPRRPLPPRRLPRSNPAAAGRGLRTDLGGASGIPEPDRRCGRAGSCVWAGGSRSEPVTLGSPIPAVKWATGWFLVLGGPLGLTPRRQGIGLGNSAGQNPPGNLRTLSLGGPAALGPRRVSCSSCQDCPACQPGWGPSWARGLARGKPLACPALAVLGLGWGRGSWQR